MADFIPVSKIFFNSVGKKGTLAIWVFIVITLWMTGMDYVYLFIFSSLLYAHFFHAILANRRLSPAIRIFTRPWPSIFSGTL